MSVENARRSPRLKDVAELAGVSTGTVSHVLNHPARVTPTTVAKVRAAIEELGFVRDSNASSLASGQTRSIGLVVIDLGNSLFVEVARGAATLARTRDLSLLTAGSEDDFEVQARNVETFNEARVAGLLLAPMQDSSAQVGRLRASGRPTVLVNYDPEGSDVCSVVVDNEQVGFLAASHLIATGATRLMFALAHTHLQPVRLRREGVRRAVAAATAAGSHLVYEEVELPDLTAASARALGLRLLGRGPRSRPDAVIAVTDILASVLLTTLVEQGVGVPEEIAVMGCDDNTSAPSTTAPLTTVSLRGQDLGRAAMGLLLEEMAEDPATHVHRRVVLEPELLPRASTLRTRPPGAAEAAQRR